MLRKLVCFIVVLGMAGVAGATDWIGVEPGWLPIGDGWDFNNADNWRDPPPAPANEPARILRRGSWSGHSGYPEYDLDITVTASITHEKPAGTRTFVQTYDQPGGHRCDITVNPDVYWGMSFFTMHAKGSLTLKPGSSVDAYGWLILSDYTQPVQQTDIAVTVEAGAYLYNEHLLHTHGMIDVYGTMRTGSVAWLQSHIGTNRVHVYDGGLFRVDWGATPGMGWGGDQALTDARVTVFLGGTVRLHGDHTDPAHYLTRVEAGEPGVWEVYLDKDRTIITLVPEPATALFLLAGLPLLRRRRRA